MFQQRNFKWLLQTEIGRNDTNNLLYYVNNCNSIFCLILFIVVKYNFFFRS